MTGSISKRFNVVKSLRDYCGNKTLVALDLLSEGRKVVVKVFRQEQFNYEREKLERALAIFAGLRHQHIVPILEVGFTKSRDLYFIREYIEQSELCPDVRSIKQLLSTVHFLNSAGYVHGGIKPSNVLLIGNDLKLSDPKICDLKAPEDREEEIRFTSPEVLNGEKATLASDLYSVGALLYRWIAGKHAFQDTEINLLKLKHMWASPKAIAHTHSGLETIPHAVVGLLHKSPHKRQPAFRALVRLLEANGLPATRAPVVGRTKTLCDLRTAISDSKKTLRTIVIEGPPGIGKSRIIEELGTICGLDSVVVAAFGCAADGPSVDRIIRAVNSIIRSHDSLRLKPRESRGRSFDASSRYIYDQEIKLPSASYPIERITSDLVGVLAALGRFTAVALVVEDIDRADSVVLKFVEQLCVRAAEVSLALVLTCRTFSIQSHLGQLLHGVLAGDFDRFQLKPLAREETRSLVGSIAQSNVEQDTVAHLSGGNPLFAEEYIRSGVQALPRAVREAIAWMRSCVVGEDMSILEALSLFTKPIKIEVLSQVVNCSLNALQDSAGRLEVIGLVAVKEDEVWLHPASRGEINGSVTSRRRIDLSKRAFGILRVNHDSVEELARWAFDGQLFSEAAALYRTIAVEDLRSKNLRSVAFCYEQVDKCSRCGALELSGLEQIQLAQTYSMIGRIREARKLFEKLLRSDSIRNDSKLLSYVYDRLSALNDKTKPDARIALLRKAIVELGETSREICPHYVRLCYGMLRIGNWVAATNALEEAEKHDDGASEEWLMGAKGTLFTHRGEFSSAIDCFKRVRGPASNPSAVSINLGLCFEHLGDLQKATALFLEAEQSSLRAGHILFSIFSIINLGCVAMKLGELARAQSCHDKALARIEELLKREPEFDRNNFMTVYSEIAAQRMHTADFKGAAEFANRSKPKKGWVFMLDRIHCELVKCELIARLGQRKQAEAKLRLFDSNPLFRVPFFQIEKRLIQVRINGHSPSTFSTLLEALGFAEKLGTKYQQCTLLNELADTCLGMNDKRRGAEFAKRALTLAQKKHYRLLGTRALLLSGVASEIRAQSHRYLYSAFQEASEMGLREIAAESAYEIGVFQLSGKNWITAQEYLMRSISIIEEIAEDVPERYRSSYLSVSPYRKALQALKACNPEVQKLLNIRSSSPDFGSEKRYFTGLYKLSTATGSASVDALVVAMVNVLGSTLSRSLVITLRSGDKKINRVVKAKQNEELIVRAEKFIGKTKERIYLGLAENTTHKPIAWIPLDSPTWEGGVYVVCGAHEPTFTEKEIEFLTIVGTIGSSALTAIETRRRDESQKRVSEFNGMIGASKAMNDVFSQIQVAASNTATVLIEGESGTGKELVAKAIHSESERAREPFVPVDCGAIPESLIEAELFGARKGSYTGATADRPGLFEAAHRGTIFLDEISNTTPALQAKLLRVIQEREVRRIGETKGRSVDVRLIVASNQSLEALVEEGKFRKDLLYRLKVLHLKVPPLRNRRDDIPMLAHAFLQKLNAANKTKKYFAHDVLNRLSNHSFPGNVRELQNVIERAYFSAKGVVISNVPFETATHEETGAGEEVQSWFKDLSEGRKDFWSAVYKPYKQRDISREKILALVDFGLRSTRGNYKTMVEKFRLKQKDYRRFIDFLRRSHCLLDFRPYRKLGTSAT
jgi:transcriptional regulator with GAF, ATPase, and Fis domain/serine/threonine protein kinase/tetratricopeptide (TPR) repeat protein